MFPFFGNRDTGRSIINGITNTYLSFQSIEAVKKLDEYIFALQTLRNETTTNIGLEIRIRRIGNSRTDNIHRYINIDADHPLDYEDYKSGIERISITSITIPPYTDVTILNRNRKGSSSILHNGTEKPKTYIFTFIRPWISNISVNPTEYKDDKTRNGYRQFKSVIRDYRFWLYVLVGLLILVAIIATIAILVNKKANKESFSSNNHRNRLIPHRG